MERVGPHGAGPSEETGGADGQEADLAQAAEGRGTGMRGRMVSWFP